MICAMTASHHTVFEERHEWDCQCSESPQPAYFSYAGWSAQEVAAVPRAAAAFVNGALLPPVRPKQSC